MGVGAFRGILGCTQAVQGQLPGRPRFQDFKIQDFKIPFKSQDFKIQDFTISENLEILKWKSPVISVKLKKKQFSQIFFVLFYATTETN